MGSDFSSFMGDVVDVVMTPFREISKMITGTISDTAHLGIDAIHDAGSELGLDTLAGDITGGIANIGNTAGNILDKGADSVFGTLDVVKYIPYVIVGFVGLFGLKYGFELISEGGKTYRRR